MGKRELLLIVGFVIAGAVVYQATVPPPLPGERTFSFSQILDHFRRGVRGNRASAELTTTNVQPAPSELTELRVNLRIGDLTITGEDRPDIEAELHVESNGYDDAEAQRLARESVLQFDPSGNVLGVTVKFPQAGRQRARLLLKVPSRLGIRIDPSSGHLSIEHVAAVELAGARGETKIQRVAGRVTAGLQNGGTMSVADAGSVRLTTRGSDVHLERIKGEVTIGLRGGELKASEIGGAIDVDSNGTDLSLDRLDATTGTVRINAVNGSVSIKGLRSDGRIDARNAEVSVVVDRVAPLAIYTEGNDPVNLTPPAGGYQLDAIASDGRLMLPEGTLRVTTNGQEQRASGTVGGGGATITIRAAHGDITVHNR